MAEDWATNVKKYVPDADDGIIAGIVRYCGIALQKRDSSLVSFGDPAETKRVRENFLKKKLALTASDEQLDAAIAKIGERMKGEKFRNRVTVYYLLAESFGKLQVFAKAARAPAAAKKPVGTAKPAKAAGGVAAAAGAVGAAALGAAGAVASGAASGAKIAGDKAAGAAGAAVKGAKAVGETAVDAVGSIAAGAVSSAKAVGETTAGAVGAVASGAKAVGETAVEAAGAAGAAVAGAAGAAAAMMGSAASAASSGVSDAASALKDGLADDKDEGGSGMSGLLWLALIAVVLGVLWWLFYGKQSAAPESSVATEQSAPASGTEAAPPAEGSIAIPTGAGVTTETRDGKPVVKVYFDTGKTDIVPAFGAAAGGLKTWLDGHAGSTLAVSGYNDKTGNAAANAALSKKRAQAVQAALVASGIAEDSAKLVKPADTTDSKVDDAAARRVEVVVQ